MSQVKAAVVALLAIVTFGCSTPSKQVDGRDVPNLDEFKERLASENVKLRGHLSRYVYGGDLSQLTYETYLAALEANVKSSGKKLSGEVRSFEEHRLISRKATFVICLRSQKVMMVLCDDADTSHIDKIARGTSLPSIGELANELGF
jgi:hypothetical protein